MGASSSAPRPDIVTAILAGGEARRLRGAVKATLTVAGHPLLTRVLVALTPQSNVTVLCVASRNVAAAWVKASALPVAVDAVENCGPLAGISAALSWTRATMPHVRAVVTVPVDVPFVPPDLVARLAADAPENGIAVAESGDRRHHAIAYWPLSLTDELQATVTTGDAGAVHLWQARHPLVAVRWSTEPYDPFFNINTDDDLSAAATIAVIVDGISTRQSS
ncbi:MAG: molybdenum cofactor guanylyltransferase MobA [Rhodospirillaceae bacterium]|nr:MAG: molybdenum cofactor guanylyltransferase MobA [Rhodospirillaceae bacterium]